ncbi:unnamed protein product [Vitrella brassicaformis CCMP3155]|uniref:CMP/dCMP-type deaminase domain-containing protein n=2 Tax=Vitrella brassicaformis TaxID=1169539 RepID=A0A0G4FTM2_VITBC|nr:unnamed protein product [Vitrella brassicaformis CCMP3155]|eukprot:CEM18211.1 unnamed protein product [Vitrella brassicaformis CCMP3155]
MAAVAESCPQPEDPIVVKKQQSPDMTIRSESTAETSVDAASANHSTEDFNPFMNAAISSALAGVHQEHGGPFGACIVKNGVIVACSHNMVPTNLDPTCHAEMNCIRQACKALSTHDLSCCELYTTCEPCPMCWGAANWARLRKIHIGCTRQTAAKYGFDDEFFYQELDLPHDKRAIKHMKGIMSDQVRKVFEESHTYKKRLRSGGGILAKIYQQMFLDDDSITPSDDGKGQGMTCTDEWMQAAIEVALEGQRKGESKEREPFGAIVVKDGVIVGRGYNTVLRDDDPTATAEVNAIRAACKVENSYKLVDHELYTTTEPDPMSLGAIYWARLNAIHIGVSQKLAAAFGHPDGLLHYKELETDFKERAIESEWNVMADGCENVFKSWKKLQGILY